MPAHLLMRCAFKFQDDTPKNRAVITMHFRRQMDILDPLSGTDATALCTDLAVKLSSLPGKGTTPLTVTAYNEEGTAPNYPIGTHTRDVAGAIKVPAVPPELAVVLSYFAVNNRPRHRGRMYFPAWLVGASSSDMSKVVPLTIRQNLQALVTDLAGLGGANVDWGVWSKTDHAFYKATDYFISDAWAVQRRRGIKETSRTTGTTSG